MRSFRRLPPFLRVVSAIGLLFIIAGLMLLLNPHWSPFHIPQVDIGHWAVVAWSLEMLGVACALVVVAFISRLRQPGRRWRIPLDSWQSQARAVALAVVAPLCGLLVNLVTAPSFVATDAWLTITLVVGCWPAIVMGLLALD